MMWLGVQCFKIFLISLVFSVESFFVCRDADVCKFCEPSVDTNTNAKQADLLIAQAPEVRSAVNLYFQFSCLVNLDFFSPETVSRCLYALLVNEWNNVMLQYQEKKQALAFLPDLSLQYYNNKWKLFEAGLE